MPTYPDTVTIDIGAFTGEQQMKFKPGSNPPAYEIDPNGSGTYTMAQLKRTADGTNWDLAAFDGPNAYLGTHNPGADSPLGDYVDSIARPANVAAVS